MTVLKTWKVLIVGLCVLTFFLTASPVFAISSSKTFQISCVVPQQVGLSFQGTAPISGSSTDLSAQSQQNSSLTLQSQSSGVTVKTNLGEDYQMVETLKQGSNGPIQLFTVTSL